MGCDIHPYIEVQINGKWLCVGVPEAHRNYAVFSKLSGVRGYPDDNTPEELLPLGDGEREMMLPEDSDEELQKAYEEWGMDAHSLTVMPLQQLRVFVRHYGRQNKNDDEEKQWQSACEVGTWLDICEEYVGSGMAEDARVVMWYDN